MWHAGIHSNMNFPAPLAAVAFLGACAGTFLSLCGILVALFVGKPKIARGLAALTGAGVVLYFSLLLVFSAGSRETDLSKGQEKYFCEIDCHLAYSVLEVKSEPGLGSTDYLVTLRARFDETTISPHRPKDAPLTPSPRAVLLVDSAGHFHPPDAVAGTALDTALIPGESYDTQLSFKLPPGVRAVKLLIRTIPQWPDHVVIGDENSWLHQKTYFAL